MSSIQRISTVSLVTLVCIQILSAIGFACPYCEKGRAAYMATKVTLVEGLGRLHHPVSTGNQEAQCFFDQGLTYCYAFNHDEAYRSFKRAAELDSNLAMAYWGMALALGTNYNLPIDSSRHAQAYQLSQKAVVLGPQASPLEQAYIRALSTRYSPEPNPRYTRLDSAYNAAMAILHQEYPDDLDAAVLYAESGMNLRPWSLWKREGIPSPGTEEIVSVLETVLRRNPDHMGANHLFIHAVEASNNPELALPCAERLRRLVPNAGHLVHMPAHTYIRSGDYYAAVESNRDAIKVDSAYLAAGASGIYTLLYYPHNIHFLAVSCAMCGRYEEALAAAEKLESYIAPYAKQEMMVEAVMPTKLLILTKFRQWDKILALPQPDKGLRIVKTIWHFARGMAFASSNNIKKAKSELSAFRKAESNLPPNALLGAINLAPMVTKVADYVLSARIAEKSGMTREAIELLTKAVEAQDTLSYDEPEGWYLSTRESLGGLLLRSGNFEKAAEVFRADLAKYPRNGRSLFGLVECLKLQGKASQATLVKQELDNSWVHADYELRVEDL